jgi:antitoxin component YwqK of YwqJK toxin-antitoxin module
MLRVDKRILIFLIIPLLLILTSSATYAALKLASGGGSVNLTAGLVGWWKMNGDALDSSSYGHNGTVTGATLATDHTGTANTAYSFNGSSNYISLGDAGDQTTNNFSVSAWFKTGSSGAIQTILDRRVSGSTGYFLTVDTDNKIHAFARDTAGHSVTVISASSVNDNSWHHVVATYNKSGNLTIYLDGSANGTPFSLSSVGSVSISANTIIGYRSYVGSSLSYFNGSLDDVRIYNRSLASTDVTALYAYQDATPKANIKAASGEKGLVGWWKMDGNIKDSSPYAKNGVATGLTPAADRKGAANKAYSFSTGKIDGFSQPISPTGSRTLCTWFSSSSTARQSLLANRAGTSGFAFVVNRTSPGNLTYYHSGGSTLEVGAGISPSIWYHACATYDLSSATAKLYINGNLMGTQTSFSTETLSSSKGAIGAGDTSSNDFSGSMDDVRIYNRALTDSEISSIYNSYNSQVSLYKPSTGSAPTSGVNLTSGLVGWWTFNGNGKDNTPQQNNGAVTGATLTTDRKGRANSAYSFSGTSQYVTVPFKSLLHPTSGISTSIWIKPTDMGAVRTYSLISNTNSGGYLLRMNNDIAGHNGCPAQQLCFLVQAGGTYRVASISTAAFTNNVWAFVTGTYDGSTVKLYLNGSLQASTTYAGNIEYTTNNPLCFGGEATPTTCTQAGEYYPGVIDDVRLYNRALSASEVTALYSVYY